jgi:TetR/AcrR family transcriptional repressor of nem operon
MSKAATKPDAKLKLLDAALSVIRAKGYSATTVDQLCAAAGVTKGAFFQMTGAVFAEAPYHHHADPLDRVLGYVAFRKALLQGGVPEFTCLVGTMVQETYETIPALREACDRSISRHAETLEADIEAAMRDRGMSPAWTAQSLALHVQAVLQGSFILAKAKGGAEVAADSIDHLARYLELLFSAGDTRAPGTESNLRGE